MTIRDLDRLIADNERRIESSKKVIEGDSSYEKGGPVETPTREQLKWVGIGIVGFVVLVLLAVLITSCTPDDGGPGEELRAAPPPASSSVDMTAQQADSFTVVATWSPVVFQGDTIREYVRETGYDDGTAEMQDTLQAIGSETFELPSPPEGETMTGFYCLRSVRRASDGSPVVAPPDSSDGRRCVSFQYTSPLSFPPPPDSLEVSPEQAVALDSVRVLPDTIRFTFLTEAGKDSTTELERVFVEGGAVPRGTTTVDTVPSATTHVAALLYADGEVVGCDGDCNQFPISAAGWENGVPYYIAGRTGYVNEFMARRLPWFRQLGA